MKRFVPYLIFSVIILTAYGVIMLLLDQQSVRQLEQSFNEQQAIHVDLAAQSIEDHYRHQILSLKAALNVISSDLDHQEAWQEITPFFVAEQDLSEYSFIGQIDDAGKLNRWHTIVPEDEDISIQLIETYFDQFPEGQEVYVSPMYATPEKQLYSLFISGIEAGAEPVTLAAVVHFDDIIQTSVAPLRSGEFGGAWVQDHYGVVIYDHEAEIIGQNVADLHANYPEILYYDELFLIEPTGKGEYSFTVERGGEIRRKLMAWNTATLGNQKLTIAMSAPDLEISNLISESRIQVIFGGIGLIVLLGVGGLWLSTSQERQLSNLIEERTEQLLHERQQLANQQKTLRVSLDAANAGVWVWNPKTGQVTWDTATELMYGLEPGTFGGTYADWARHLHPDDRAPTAAKIEAAMQDDTPYSAEFRITRADNGEQRYLVGHGHIVRNQEGDVEQFIGVTLDITEQKQNERALAKIATRLKEAQQIALLGSWEWSLASDSVRWSDELYQMLGLEPMSEPLDFEFWLTHTHEDDQIFMRSWIETVRQGKHKTASSHRMIRADGSILHVSILGNAERNNNGDLIGAFGTVQDVTERDQVTRQLQKYSRQLEALREIALTLTSTLNLSEILDLLLGELQKLVPYDSASIIFDDGQLIEYVILRNIPTHMNFAEIAEDVKKTWHYQQLRILKQPLVVANVQENPSWIWREETKNIRSWMGIPLVFKGNFIGALNVDHNEIGFFTEEHRNIAVAIAYQAAFAIENAKLYADLEKRVEKRTSELKASETRARALLEAIPDIVFRINDKGIIMDCRVPDAYSSIFVDETLINAYIDDANFAREVGLGVEAIQQTLADETMRTFEYPYHATYETPKYFEIRMIAQSQNEVTVLIRDVTIERELRAQQQRFIGTVVHDLRTPLQIIMNKSYLMRKQPEALEKHLGVLEKVSLMMGQLIDDLLDITRFESGIVTLEKSPTDMIDLIKNVVSQSHTLAEEKSLELSYEVSSDIPSVTVDPLRMHQVIMNLVTNAINYTQQGFIKIHAYVDNDQLIIDVQDSGVGIPEEFLPNKIFEPFNRANKDGQFKGTGLGLAITRNIVQLHGGYITVKSEVEKGSTFTIHLPINTEKNLS